MSAEEIESATENQQQQTRGKGDNKSFIIIGFIFAAVYLIAGIYEPSIEAAFVGVWCLIITVLFFLLEPYLLCRISIQWLGFSGS